MSFFDFFRNVWQKLGRLFADKDTEKKAKSFALRVAGVIEHALPVVEAVTAMTPTKADDAVVDEVAFWTEKLKEVGLSPDNVFVAGAKSAMSVQGLREWMEAEFKKNGLLRLGETVFTSLASIQSLKDSEIQTAVQAAYALKRQGVLNQNPDAKK